MKTIRIICSKHMDTDEIMIHWPNGKVEFHGIWSLIKLMWWAIRNGFKIEVVDEK